MLLLCALIVGSGSSWADDYELYSGTITEGDYVIVYDGNAMKNTITSNRFDYQAVTISADKISNPVAAIIWHIAANETYWTIYNANASKYAASTGAANKAQLLTSGTDDKSLWTVSGSSTYEFVNKQNTTNKVNANLRKNGTYGFACYGTGTGGALSLYKKVEATGAATTVTINSTGITNTNKFNGTAAGTLTAAVTVTATSAAVDGAAVTWSSDDESVATVGETTGVVTLVGEGTATITATYAGKSGEYKSSYAEYELTVTNEDPNAITLWSEDFSTYSKDDVPSDGTYGYTCDNGGGTTKIYEDAMAGGTSPELLVAKTNGYFQAIVPLENIKGDLKLKFKKYNNALSVSTSTDGISISGTSSFSDAGEFTVTFTGVTTSMTSITIKFTSTSGSNVRLDDIVLKGSKVIPVTVGKNGYTTFASTYGLDLTDANRPAGLKAYKATRSGANITFTALNQTVAAGTGLLLLGANDGSYDIPYVASGTAVDGNALVGVTTATAKQSDPSGNYYFVMKKATSSSDALAFAPLSTSAAVTIPAGKAYIEVPNSAFSGGAHDLTFGFEDTGATGICSVENDELQIENAKIYNLAGQRVAQPTKGLYIVNGKKVIVK